MAENFTKDNLRSIYAQKREDVELTEIAEYAHNITDKILAAYDWKNANSLLSYAPINHEIDPTIFENQLKGAFPQIDIQHAIASPEALIPQTQFDAVLIPCIAADKEKYRLGSGGGWYDKFLAQYPDTFSIGLVYEFAIVDELPREEHDMPLSVLITPNRTIR
jgi:5-formyltetrahydrofolate cyclo-ligase